MQLQVIPPTFFFYLRHPANVPNNIVHAKEMCLSNLYSKRAQQLLKSKIDLTDKVTNHYRNISELKNAIITDFKELLGTEFPECEVPTLSLDIEAIHTWTCAESLIEYYGTLHKIQLQYLNEYFVGPGNDVMLLTGLSGTGKSTLLAQFIKELYQNHPTIYNYPDSIFDKPLPSMFLCRKDIVKLGVITRFIGCDYLSTEVNKVIKSIIKDISVMCEFNIPDSQGKDLATEFQDVLCMIPSEKFQFLIILDGVDRLTCIFDYCIYFIDKQKPLTSFEYFNIRAPPNVKIFMSATVKTMVYKIIFIIYIYSGDMAISFSSKLGWKKLDLSWCEISELKNMLKSYYNNVNGNISEFENAIGMGKILDDTQTQVYILLYLCQNRI